jgi:arginyl-tRNA synthetase
MDTLLHLLNEKFKTAILRAFPQVDEAAVPLEVAQSTQEKFGHYQCNSAMKLAALLQQNPRKIAETLVSLIQKEDPAGMSMLQRLDVAGPGFINIWLEPHYLSAYLNRMDAHPLAENYKAADPQKIAIDFSSPNTAKEMHVGHLRSTIIGDALARFFEFQGHTVVRLNHIGDWGTAFGMLIAHMKSQAPDVLSGKVPSDLSHLVEWYKASKKRFDEDPAFKKAAQLEVVMLQGGNQESLQAWQLICEISRKAYQEVYDLLDIKIMERGESFYNSLLPMIVADLESKGLITLSDGAKCLFLEGFQNREGEPLPLMVQKSDGGYNYDTTDMATIWHRIFQEKADRLIYVTDAGQAQHFRMIFKAAEKAGYLDPKRVRTDHVPFGLVLGEDGKKFRTRSGETERLMDLLTAAIAQADQILEKRTPSMPAEERHQTARILGIGAIKYADLTCHRVSDYVFSYERMLRFEGNTAAYLMYAYVRAAGIKRRVGAEIEAVRNNSAIKLEHPQEVSLGMHLARFGEVLEQMAEDLLPNRLTDYLYTLAEKFNAFFRDCRVEGSPEQDSRLLLCDLAARIMKQGLEILGVKTLEKM